MHDGVFDGSVFSWLSPFALLCGVGLCLGYVMLGAGWLVLKTETAVRDFSYTAMAIAISGIMVFLPCRCSRCICGWPTSGVSDRCCSSS